jgi:O-acetyl-ADP-ribose deacetylase
MPVDSGPGAIELVQGDITRLSVDAIVNAANSALGGGGGVDGAIHRAAGPSLLRACLALPVVSRGERCPTGEVRVTDAGKLSARFVIHGVGPIYSRHASSEAARLLRLVHVSALQEAGARGCTSVALPAISCGVYGYPIEEAAPIAIAAAREALHGNGPVTRVVFALFEDAVYRAWTRALEQ